MFGFACERCWDRDCKCTPEELAAHRQLSTSMPRQELKYSEKYKAGVGDMVALWDPTSNSATDEFVIRDVTDDGNLIGQFIDNRNDARQEQWPYETAVRICAVSFENEVQ